MPPAELPTPPAPVSRVRTLTDAQASQLALWHLIQGLSPQDIVTQHWPLWTEGEVRAALRSTRVQQAISIVEEDARQLSARSMVQLHLAGSRTIERLIRIAHGLETTREYTGKDDPDGNPITRPVPWEPKLQQEALLWHAERVLPPAPKSGNDVPGGQIVNIQVLSTTMGEVTKSLTRVQEMFSVGTNDMGKYLRQGEDLIEQSDPIIPVEDPSSDSE